MPLVRFNLVILISGADSNPFDPSLLLYFVKKSIIAKLESEPEQRIPK
jgi:hypothetical protein